jgi:dTDP-4-dehydrorhamnose 3,5-epimerase
MSPGMAEPVVKGEPVEGVSVIPLAVHSDARGWLAEIFRSDDPAVPAPAMAYVSMTRPGIVRGPHEHREQTDIFCFVGPSKFRITLWDAREASATRGAKMVIEAGDGRPGLVVVPPGVIHAYRNIGLVDGLVFNCPDRLFAGRGRKEPVDEIRHEDAPGSPYRPE